MTTQYAICHLQRGSGNDSGISCHIEKKDAKGKVYVPENADASRTHLNRELIVFPEGVTNRTAAIQHRLASGGPARLHIGTGAGGSQSDMPWDGKHKRRR